MIKSLVRTFSLPFFLSPLRFPVIRDRLAGFRHASAILVVPYSLLSALKNIDKNDIEFCSVVIDSNNHNARKNALSSCSMVLCYGYKNGVLQSKLIEVTNATNKEMAEIIPCSAKGTLEVEECKLV